MTAWPIRSLSISSSSWTARRIASALPNKKNEVVVSIVSVGSGRETNLPAFQMNGTMMPYCPDRFRLPEPFSCSPALRHDGDVDQPEILFREFLPVDSEPVKPGDGRLRVPARVENGMPGKDPPGNLLWGEHELCPGIPQVPVKGDLVDNRYDPGRCERPYPEDNACRRPLVLADDHKIRVFDPCLLPCLRIIVIPPYDKRPPPVFQGKFACLLLIVLDNEHLLFREGQALHESAGQFAVPYDHSVVKEGMGGPVCRCRAEHRDEVRGEDKRDDHEDHEDSREHHD